MGLKHSCLLSVSAGVLTGKGPKLANAWRHPSLPRVAKISGGEAQTVNLAPSGGQPKPFGGIGGGLKLALGLVVAGAKARQRIARLRHAIVGRGQAFRRPFGGRAIHPRQ
jgi:hypothetical protein